MYTMPFPQMWAPSEPPVKRARVESYTPPVSPYKLVVVPTYNHTYIGIGDLVTPKGLTVRRLVFHPVPQTPDKLSEQLVVRK